MAQYSELIKKTMTDAEFASLAIQSGLTPQELAKKLQKITREAKVWNGAAGYPYEIVSVKKVARGENYAAEVKYKGKVDNFHKDGIWSANTNIISEGSDAQKIANFLATKIGQKVTLWTSYNEGADGEGYKVILAAE